MIQNGKKEHVLKDGRKCILVQHWITENEFKKLLK